MNKKVLVPLAEGCEELEAVTIIDLLRRAGVEVRTASLGAEQVVTASHGVRLVADSDLDSALEEEYDMVVLPGGMPGARLLEEDQRLRELLTGMHARGRRIAAICAAPRVLAAAGLLAGRAATSYPGFLDAKALPDTELRTDPVVTDGTLTTSRGPGTAMDFALSLVELLTSREQRATLEESLQRP